jgi:hypothetical protein
LVGYYASNFAGSAYRGLDQGIAAGKALRTQALKDLSRRRGIPLQQAGQLRFERIEWAGVWPWRAGVEVFLGQPGGHRAGIEGECPGDL